MSKRPYDHTGKPHSRDWREENWQETYAETGKKPLREEETPPINYKKIVKLNPSNPLSGEDARRLYGGTIIPPEDAE